MDGSGVRDRAASPGDPREVPGLTATESQELIALLRCDAIVRSSRDLALVDRQGTPRPWGLYTPNVTLTARGLDLTGRALLARLAGFQSTQIAASGFTAMPLLAACVQLGQGRYSGLIIRDKAKPYLTRRRIDGPGDRARPVVLVDDSIGSGMSMHIAVEALEQDGFEVEGLVALVCFPHRGGPEWAYGAGYRVESVFDVWRDLRMLRPARRASAPVPEPGRSGREIPEGLPAALAARKIAEAYLTDGLPPRPPASLDRAHDARGGVWVSFRERSSEHRAARDGFWRFDPQDADLCRDLVAATVRTIDRSAGAVTLERLGDLKIAVTVFGPLERVSPAQLDFDRYGVVVRDRATGRKLGGALPNTQVFISEMGQYYHARTRNAGISRSEPHDLFRHDLVKLVEPGATWLPYGVPDDGRSTWSEDVTVGRALLERARALAGVGPSGRACRSADAAVPYPVDGVAIAFYDHGRAAIGAAMATGHEAGLDDLLGRAARRALATADGPGLVAAADVVITLLHDPEDHGHAADVAAGKLRRGRDAVVASTGAAHRIGLPSAIPYSNLTRRELIASLSRAGDGQSSPPRWRTYRTSAWLARQGRVLRLEFGFPRRTAETADPRGTIRLLAGHILNRLDGAGLPAYHLDPVRGIATQSGTSARIVSALVALGAAGDSLGRSDWATAATRGLSLCLEHVGHGEIPGALELPDQRNGILGDCMLLIGACAAGSRLRGHPAVPDLVTRITGLIHPDGRICRKPVRLHRRQDHDFLPGVVLLAAAEAVKAHLCHLDSTTLGSCLRWHRGRFRALRSWAMAGWQPQAWARLWELTREDAQAEFVFEVADWAIEHQVAKTGAFLEDLAYKEPTFNTGFIAEGIAAAWATAIALGAADHAARYRQSWQRAVGFLDRLIVQADDTFCMAAPDAALGGVRTTLTRSDIRIDAVSHTLRAFVAGEMLQR